MIVFDSDLSLVLVTLRLDDALSMNPFTLNAPGQGVEIYAGRRQASKPRGDQLGLADLEYGKYMYGRS